MAAIPTHTSADRPYGLGPWLSSSSVNSETTAVTPKNVAANTKLR